MLPWEPLENKLTHNHTVVMAYLVVIFNRMSFDSTTFIRRFLRFITIKLPRLLGLSRVHGIAVKTTENHDKLNLYSSFREVRHASLYYCLGYYFPCSCLDQSRPTHFQLADAGRLLRGTSFRFHHSYSGDCGSHRLGCRGREATENTTLEHF
jgi:hypothetical protein